MGGCYIIILPRSSTIFLCVRIRPFDSLINEVFVSTATLNLWSSRLLLVLNSFHAYLNLPPAPSFRLFFISLCLPLSLRLAFGAGRAWCQWTIRHSHRYVLTWWAVRWRHPFFFIRFVLLGIPNNIPHAAGQAVLDDDDGQSEFIVTQKKKAGKLYSSTKQQIVFSVAFFPSPAVRKDRKFAFSGAQLGNVSILPCRAVPHCVVVLFFFFFFV